MEKEVFINRITKFLPNNSLDNDSMENYLGKIGEKPSRVKSIILRQNGIKSRYYALNQKNEITHTNAEMVVCAINGLLDDSITIDDIDMLICATSVPDQIVPSHASMVHGLLKNKQMEIMSPSGVCACGVHALKIAYMSIKSGNSKNAICTGSELASGMLHSKNYKEEYDKLRLLEEKPMIAFEKDFLRFMLSDGAGAMLLEKERRGKISLKIEWIETVSYANEAQVCMYMGAEKIENGELKSWKSFSEKEWLDNSVFALKQDVRMLDSKVIKLAVCHLKTCFEKYNLNPSKDFNYFLPHLSSMVFKEKLQQELEYENILIPLDKWFINLSKVGNVGSASIYLALEELYHSGKLKKGERIFLSVPESGRFSYASTLLTVV
jgi:3-oxoacyl-[acyl-carrier-protein] synthase-3